jgi:hypothetical protein
VVFKPTFEGSTHACDPIVLHRATLGPVLGTGDDKEATPRLHAAAVEPLQRSQLPIAGQGCHQAQMRQRLLSSLQGSPLDVVGRDPSEHHI